MIIARSEHSISRKNISKNALRVLYALRDGGFEAYLVGGAVRDLLLGFTPKDFDVATNANPEQISKLFKNCRLIGRRFRLAHVYFRNEIIEVATFRSAEAHYSEDGMILRSNVYGTIEEDAFRRDLTINALYYNIADFTVTDLTGGFDDIKRKTVRIIGDPKQRFTEDPVRMIRVVRLAAKLDLTVAPDTYSPISQLANILLNVPSSRLFDETAKWFLSSRSLDIFLQLYSSGIFKTLFPQTAATLEDAIAMKFLKLSFTNTDSRLQLQKPTNPAFLFAVLMWHPLLTKMKKYQDNNMHLFTALHSAMHEVMREQIKIISIPHRLTNTVKTIWTLQFRFQRHNAKYDHKKTQRIFSNPRFRAAYDFLVLRAQSGEGGNISKLADWWTKFQESKK